MISLMRKNFHMVHVFHFHLDPKFSPVLDLLNSRIGGFGPFRIWNQLGKFVGWISSSTTGLSSECSAATSNQRTSGLEPRSRYSIARNVDETKINLSSGFSKISR